MVMCFAPDCKHYSERGTCKSFFTFPTDTKQRQRWIKLIRREDQMPTKYSRVCSCHFKNGDKREGPTMFVHNVEKQFLFESPEKKQKLVEDVQKNVNLTLPEPTAGPSWLEDDPSQPLDKTEKSMDVQNPSFVALTSAENYFLRQEVERLQLQLKSLKIRFSFEHIENDDHLVNVYTGMPTKQVFMDIYHLMSRFEFCYYQKYPQPSNVAVIQPIDQMLLTLMKLRMNLLFDDLGVRFAIDRRTASNIFITWVYALHEILFKFFMKDIPTRNKNKLCMPSSFSTFTNCRVVVDCTEMPAIHPKQMDKQKLTYSAYKSRNTVKGLIGTAPNGVITFASELYPGSTSDKKITQLCGIITKFESGDLIIADKGFLISDSLPEGVALNIPPFLSTPQFTPEQVIVTRTIARARIHVERAIRRIKCFHILNLIPATLMPHASVVFQLCAALTNVQFPLIKEVENLFKE